MAFDRNRKQSLHINRVFCISAFIYVIYENPRLENVFMTKTDQIILSLSKQTLCFPRYEKKKEQNLEKDSI